MDSPVHLVQGACMLRVKEMSTYIVRYVQEHPVLCNCASTASNTAAHHHHPHSGVLSGSTIGQDDGKRRARHLVLHFPCLLQEQHRDLLSVFRRLTDDEQELHIPRNIEISRHILSKNSPGSTQVKTRRCIDDKVKFNPLSCVSDATRLFQFIWAYPFIICSRIALTLVLVLLCA